MKFTITKEDFLEGLQQVQHVVSSRTTLPILSNVLIEADGSSLRLTTTDLDVGVTGSVKAKVKQSGSTTLPARRLAGIVRELPANEVSVEVDSKNTASIRSGPIPRDSRGGPYHGRISPTPWSQGFRPT